MSRPASKSALLAALALLAAGCPAPPTESLPSECDAAGPLEFRIEPATLRVGTPTQLLASGGSGVYTYGVSAGGSGGALRGTRFIAGATPAEDQLFVKDALCQTEATAVAKVIAAFAVAPTQATLLPGTSFDISVAGLLGDPVYALASNGSGATLTGSRYTAGATDGIDLVQVRDAKSGDEAVLQFQVRAGARFRGSPALLAAPPGGEVPLSTTDGTNAVSWAKLSGPGAVDGARLIVAPTDRGTAVLEATDRFTGLKATVSVRVLDELTRTTQGHGRLTDVAAMVAADFDGDGIEDLAVGQGESSLSRPGGGAVFIFKGGPDGLSGAPTWTLTGSSDTAALGTALAAGDLDGDGKADLVASAPGDDVTSSDSGSLSFFHWTANGPAPMRPALSGVGKGRFGTAFALADVDGDGDLDLVVGSPTADLAATSTISSRGVIDVFLLQRGEPIPDLPTWRLGGTDLAADGTLRAATNLQLGRAIAVGDLNGDGRPDLSALQTVNYSVVSGATARAQPALAVWYSRGGTSPYLPTPDAFVVPTNVNDTSEGTYRLAYLAADGGRPALLAVMLDQADLNASVTNVGAALLFQLSGAGAGEAPATPVQQKRDAAFAQLFGDTAGIQAARSFAVLDVDGAPGAELVLGAPYAAGKVTGLPDLRYAGAALAYPLATLTAGTVSSAPIAKLYGANAADCLGAGLGVWTLGGARGLVAVASRATTAQGQFTGRVDQYLPAAGGLSAWPRRTVALPAKPAGEDFAIGLALSRTTSGAFALVGAPSYSGPGTNADGNDLGSGRAFLHPAGGGEGAVLAEGASSPTLAGGRAVGRDVAFTDFNGDGLPDALVGAPNQYVPASTTSLTGTYANVRAGCQQATSYSPGAVQVHLARADGTFVSAYRLWAPMVFGDASCTATDSTCRRSQLGTRLAGGFDFNGDGKQDLAAIRSNGFEIFLGRPLDDTSLVKLTLGCDPAFSSAYQAGATAPAPLGDLDGDGCSEVGYRTGSNYVVVYGFDAGGARCGGKTQASWVKLAADSAAGLNNLGFGLAATRAGKVLGTATDYLAISATNFPLNGVGQEAVVLLDVAQVNAQRPASGEAVVPLLGGPLTPIGFAHRLRYPGFGASLAGGTDLTGDGKPDLVVGATGATIASDGGGAVFVFSGAGRTGQSFWDPALVLVGETGAKSLFGNALSLLPGDGNGPPLLGVGAVNSYRQGTRNGTAFTIPLAF